MAHVEATGIRFIKILSQDVESTSQTLDAGAETSVLTIRGNGFAIISFSGDGGATIKMRVYTDNLMTAEVAANAPNSAAAAFSSSLEIRAYNPGTEAVTENTSSLRVRGGLF